MKLITNYMLDEDLRHKLNALTQKTFGFDFEAKVFDGEDDYRLFYIGDELKSIKEEALYFPQLSHA